MATAAVLSSRFRVRASRGNYNNELGVPLTILGFDSPGKNIFGWLALLLQAAIGLIFGEDYPEVLVLELGADRPGDIGYLMDLLGPVEAGVLTYIGNSHLEFFANEAELAREKLTLVKKLPASAAAIMNFDSPKVYEGRGMTKASVMGYGLGTDATLQATDLHVMNSSGQWGINFKVHSEGHVVPFFVPALGQPAVYAALAGAAVGLKFGINLVQASEALKDYAPPPGRLRVLAGIKHTQILDDTYNAAPASAIAALEALADIAAGRRLAALGSMAELGAASDAGHRAVARKLMETGVTLIFLVGQEAKIIQDELARRQFTGRVSWYPDADAARLAVQAALMEGDTILVKGSQAARMEKIVKEIMAQPEQASQLLVRQGPGWK
jgi:UDP-N-acetylmuramoyl-tripeptide--D-alanyl-D-alanine ligase